MSGIKIDITSYKALKIYETTLKFFPANFSAVDAYYRMGESFASYYTIEDIEVLLDEMLKVGILKQGSLPYYYQHL